MDKKLFALFCLFKTFFSLSTFSVKLSDNFAVKLILVQVSTKKHVELNMLVDPLSTVTMIFENKLPPNTINKVTRTGLIYSSINSYGNFTGEMCIEEFLLDKVNYRTSFFLINEIYSTVLTQTYDGILGIGLNRISEYSIFNNAKYIKPYVRYNKIANTLYFGFQPKSSRAKFKMKFYNARERNQKHVMFCKLFGLAINNKDTLNFEEYQKLKISFYNKDYILVPKAHENLLYDKYFVNTLTDTPSPDEKEKFIYSDDSEDKENNYKNYFYSVGNKPKSTIKTEVILNEEKDKIPFSFHYLLDGIDYSTVKLEKENSDFWDIGINIFNYDNIDIDYDKKEMYFYNDEYKTNYLFAFCFIVSILGIIFIFFFFV